MRLDQFLVADGQVASRARAQMLINEGVVKVNGELITKPAYKINDSDTVEMTGQPIPWVSRAGVKLAYAFDHYNLSPDGQVVLDIGASTGGFTEICLERGAEHVYAVDVGRDQLHKKLRNHPAVTVLEGINAKDLSQKNFATPPHGLVADVSFISLLKVLPIPLSLLMPSAWLVVLIKPQFELEPALIGKGGIVRDAEARMMAVNRVRNWLQGAGWHPDIPVQSPITGKDGNQEYLLAVKREC